MENPSSVSSGSIMPNYPWLLINQIDTSTTKAKIAAMIKLGVPYDKGYEEVANEDLMKQAIRIQENLAKDKIEVEPTDEIVALIAYLQRIGTDIKASSDQK